MQRRRDLIICLVLALATAGAYWPVHNNGFVHYDDPDYLTENSHVQGGLTAEGFRWALSSVEHSNWHPLTWLSHMLDCQLFGLQAGEHHLVNLALHIANSLLLYLVLVRMTGAAGPSVLVACLFALHPLHVESVAWASERKDTLSSLFWMLCLGAYVHYARQPRWRRYVPVVLLLGLGLTAKAMLVTLPCVLLLLDYWPLGRWPGRGGEFHQATRWQLVGEKLPLLALAVVASRITMRAQSNTIWTWMPWSQRVANALVSYVIYLYKTVWPVSLAIFYPHPAMVGELAGWQVLGAFVLLVGITVLLVRWRRQRPYLMAGWLWYLGTLVPVIGLVQVGRQARADRYMYIPSIGLFLMLAWGIQQGLVHSRLSQRGRMAVQALGAIGVIGICGALTYVQVGYWKDTLTLFAHALEVTQNNYVAHQNIADVCRETGHPDQALAHYDAAVSLAPNDASTQCDMGNALAESGQVQAAIPYYLRALKLAPDNPEVHANWANRLAALGQHREAIVHYRKALQLGCGYEAVVHTNLGLSLGAQGQLAEAIAEFTQAIAIDPAYAKAHYSLALAWTLRGDSRQAAAQYRQAIRLNSRWPEALDGLARILATDANPAIRQPQEAIDLAQRACTLTQFRNPVFVDTLAAAAAAAGHFADAVLLAGEARERARQLGQKELAQSIEKRLALYQMAQPFYMMPGGAPARK